MDSELYNFQGQIQFQDTVNHIPVQVIQQLHKQGVYVRPKSMVVNQVLQGAFVMDAQGREKKVQVFLKSNVAAAYYKLVSF